MRISYSGRFTRITHKLVGYKTAKIHAIEITYASLCTEQFKCVASKPRKIKDFFEALLRFF